MSARDTIARFNKTAAETDKKLGKNPFSDTYVQPVYKKGDERYGRPPEGSKTEKRGIKAGVYVMREILFLCEFIDRHAQPLDDGHGQKIIKFGPLFDLYSRYSDKLVGMLLRARKYGLVHFEGEMLYQRQDDNKIVTLLRPIADIKAAIRSSNDPANCMQILLAPVQQGNT